jgi:heme exporter protein D
MDTLLLGITIVSLIVALVMSVTAWRLMRDETARASARVAALSAAASMDAPARAPWKPAPIADEPVAAPEPTIAHASGFLGAAPVEHDGGTRQRTLAVAAVGLFVILSGSLVSMMSRPEGTSAVAVGPNAPLELVSLSHARQQEKLAVSGLVRNPVNGTPVERLTAVVFLFDAAGTFVTSSRAHVDFLKLGAGDETPFVVSLDAPAAVARYRVSFRTDEGVVPHVDRRGAPPVAGSETPVSVAVK